MSDMINYYEELDQLLREAGESPASLSPSTEYKELKSVCRKLRKTWSTRANANTDKKELAQSIVDVLNLISQTIGSEEEKQAYDAQLRVMLEEERRRREEEERREREYRERMERLAAEERRKQEEERRRIEEEERKRREEYRKQEEARRAARREQLAREARAAREAELRRRASKPSIIGFVLNVALMLLIIWPTLSLTGILPKPIACAPAVGYFEYTKQVSEFESGTEGRWKSDFSSTFKARYSDNVMAGLFEDTNANHLADDDWYGSTGQSTLTVTNGAFFYSLGTDSGSVSSGPVRIPGSGRIYVSPSIDNHRLFVTKGHASSRSELGISSGSEKFYKEVFKKKSAEEIRTALYEMLLEPEKKIRALPYYACAYAKAQGILLDYRDETAYFAEDQGDTLLVYQKGQGDRESRLLHTINRTYEGEGCGYFLYRDTFVYADGNAVKTVSASDANAQSQTICELVNPVHEINYTVHQGHGYLMALDLEEGHVEVVSMTDPSVRGGVALDAGREVGIMATGDLIWFCYHGESPNGIVNSVLKPVRGFLDAAMPYVKLNENETSVMKKYVLYDMAFKRWIGDGQATFRTIRLNEVLPVE